MEASSMNKRLHNVWSSLKKSFHCKSDFSHVHDQKNRTAYRSGCSRSIANLKDVIHGTKHHLDKPSSCSSPCSIGSSEFLNPITHEVILDNSTSELKITGTNGETKFLATPRPVMPVNYSSSYQRNKRACLKRDFTTNENKSSVSCYKCDEKFTNLEDAESHHLAKHAVSELMEGDSSRKIVEIICRTSSLLKTENQRIERILKVHNLQKTLARFEGYRDNVKTRASKLQKKHPRCIADGNELLRFHGTTVACRLGLNGTTSVCSTEKCAVCRILRNGFSAKREIKNGIGVFTAATSGKAFDSIVMEGGDVTRTERKALIVCRVVAGRVHRPVEDVEEMMNVLNGFDSLAGKVGLYTNVEELYLLNYRALLPCFVVICKS
ncbi:unnamed protein product [Cochlearia groenlandica]